MTYDDEARPADRYEELMRRRAALSAEVMRRIQAHHEEAVRQMRLSGGRHPVGASTDGIRLAADGSLDAIIKLDHAHGAQTRVVLRADPGRGVEEFDPSRGVAIPVPKPVQALDETDARRGKVIAIALEHLPPTAAGEFVELLLPALRLVPATEGQPVVAQLGGLPTLPVNSWPVWEGHGPLSHVLSFDCAPVAELLPELGIPSTGRLAFFHYVTTEADHDSTVGTWDPTTRPGFRVLHVHPEQSTPADITDAATPAPPGLNPFRTVALTAVRTITWPDSESLAAHAVWLRHGLADPESHVPGPEVRAFYDALRELPAWYDVHQIGGHAAPQQGPVELEVEQLHRGLEGQPFEWRAPEVRAAAGRWRLLLQVASDERAGMMWGDVGQLYFLATDMRRPEEALFTWQCG